VVIALVVTPEGFPLAYEVLAGNTSDRTTLATFLAKIEGMYGKARRVWLMDRGVPKEEDLARMRADGVGYVVGTPKSLLAPHGAESGGPAVGGGPRGDAGETGPRGPGVVRPGPEPGPTQEGERHPAAETQGARARIEPAEADVELPTTDGRVLVLPRYTEPEAEQEILLEKLGLSLPAQPPPRIRTGQLTEPTDDGAQPAGNPAVL